MEDGVVPGKRDGAIPHRPADGKEGMRKNLAMVKRTRDLLGPDGRDWRDVGFARHLAGRLVRLRRRGRSP